MTSPEPVSLPVVAQACGVTSQVCVTTEIYCSGHVPALALARLTWDDPRAESSGAPSLQCHISTSVLWIFILPFGYGCMSMHSCTHHFFLMRLCRKWLQPWESTDISPWIVFWTNEAYYSAFTKILSWIWSKERERGMGAGWEENVILGLVAGTGIPCRQWRKMYFSNSWEFCNFPFIFPSRYTSEFCLWFPSRCFKVENIHVMPSWAQCL